MPAHRLPKINYVWTQKLAYVVGLLATDGNLSSDGRHIIMRSAEKDQLTTFKKCLEVKNKIGSTRKNGFSSNCFRVQISNVQLYKWLIAIGLTPAKTYTIGKLKIPKKYYPDFLRGHLDGDGYIQTYKDTYNVYKDNRYINTRIYTRFISASKNHIEWLIYTTRKYLPVKGALLQHKDFRLNRVPMWEARFSKYDSLKLLKWMYYSKDIPSLKRKRNIAEKLLSAIQNEKLVRI